MENGLTHTASPSAFIGVLMLDTAFPRIVGDAGNPSSYAMPVKIQVVTGADSADIVVDGQPANELINCFCDSARSLQSQGATAIVSTCGFLISSQQEIATSVSIPVMLSALTLFPVIRATVGSRPVGVLTASKLNLGSQALKAAGIGAEQVSIVGMEDCEIFSNTFIVTKENQRRGLDSAALEHSVVAHAQTLIAQNPDIAAILLECGNLPPYADAIRRATRRPVFSILDGAQLMWARRLGRTE